MVANLPLEIILAISKHLDFGEKLSLMTTCRRIHDLISKTSLYIDLDLLEYRNAQDIIRSFQSKELEGSQVKILRVNTDYLVDDELLSQLSIVFPNVTRMINRKEGHFTANKFEFHDGIIAPAMHRWINTIEKYNMFSDWYEIFPALKYHTFPRLVELQLGNAFYFKAEMDGLDPLYFTPFIKHAPNLTTLRLCNCDISLKFLEEVHANCPQMKTLKFVNTVISVEIGVLLQGIVPANNTSKLAFKRVLTLDEDGVLLDYIRLKYPNLYHFKFDIIDHPESARQSIGRFFSPSCFSQNEIKNALRSNTRSFRITFKTYCENGSRFISSLPSTIKVLKVKVAISDNLLKDVSESKMNLKTLKLRHCSRSYFNIVAESHDIQYIQHLSRLKTFKAMIDHSVLATNLDIVSNSVSTLFLQVSGDASKALNLEWILFMFPSLESLYLKYSCKHVSGSVSHHEKRHYPKLRFLSVMDCGIRQELFKFIKTATPNLRQLELMMDNRSVAYSYYNKEILEYKLDVDLSGLRLESCKLLLENESPSGNHIFSCNIKMKNKSKRVLFLQRHNAIAFPSEQVDEDDDDDGDNNITKVTIIYDDVKHFTINGYSVLKVNSEIMIAL